MSVRRASIQYNVPMQTLRDRVLHKVDPETVRSGPQPLFSEEEEALFVNNLKYMASLGYGYTGPEVIAKASNYAVHLGKRSKDQPLSEKWYSGLKSRWPELKTLSPRALAKERAQATSEHVVNSYYENLHTVLLANDLLDKPECIYNFDEKGVQTEHRPPKVVAEGVHAVPAITSPRSSITTILGCGNALGTQHPPYFIFIGQRMNNELLAESTPGVSGCVTDSGWSNSDTFLKYLNDHFLKFVQRPDESQPILLIFDGHRSHINIPVIEWAKQHNIILFVLPAHTSHLLQPLDVGCFGPLQRVYNSECHKFLRTSPESRITRYNVCKLACSAYAAGLSASNLRSAFQKTGIYPFQPAAISKAALAPADAYHLTPMTQNTVCSQKPSGDPRDFFSPDQELIAKKQEFESKKEHKNTVSKIVSGKCITNPVVEKKIIEFSEGQKKRKTESSKTGKVSKNKKVSKLPKPKNVQKKPLGFEPQPGPSKVVVYPSDSSDFSDTEITDSEKCCVCHKFEPEELRNIVSLVFVKWAKCDIAGCDHWTHLKFCCPQRVVRYNDSFECPCHQRNSELTEE
ncbi:uncharacterized protein LOC123531140 isoform X2 [Mercenaria mercenaria]|nr:uncharacterized protein LOC123531140 isoform X2 [Mercenaria mercenaria]